MLFDFPHITFLAVSFTMIALLLFGASKLLKTQKSKDRFLLLFAVITVVIHFSSLYVTFFKTGEAEVESSMLLPIYPCNIAMWLTLIAASIKNKQSRAYKPISEFAFYLGVLGGVIGLLFNDIYASDPNLASWDVLKGMLSHSTMLVACLYLLVGGYIKIRVNNTVSVFFGLVMMIVLGYTLLGAYSIANIDPPNIMFLVEPPLDGVKWINTWTIGIAGLIVAFLITAAYEQIALKKEERWYAAFRRNEDEKVDN